MRLPTKNTKNQLSAMAEEHGPSLAVVPAAAHQHARPPLGELELWTYHPDEIMPTSLVVFRDGEYEPAPAVGKRWAGPFNGRPELIAELFPQLESEFAGKSLGTVQGALYSLRSWWRLLDLAERDGSKPVRSSLDLTDLHRQKAFDSEMNQDCFSWFINRAVNPTLVALRLLGVRDARLLHWRAPERPTPGAAGKVVPEVETVDPIRLALKHDWFAALHRWERTQSLLNLGRPRTILEAGLGDEATLDEAGWRRNEARLDEESALLKQYLHYEAGKRRVNGRVPRSVAEVHGDMDPNAFFKAGFKLEEMQRGFFPDSNDIRAAFMLCLASTGWNPQTLLDLDATKVNEFIVEHPRNDPQSNKAHQYLMKSLSGDRTDAPPDDEDDGAHFFMTGWKDRAKHEVYTEGLKKSRASAPVVVLTLIERTAPLRERLRDDLAELQVRYHGLSVKEACVEKRRMVHKRISQIRQGICSPWLYIWQGEIHWLNNKNYDVAGPGRPWLRAQIDRLNARLPVDCQLPYIVAKDFRKIYGNYWYRTSNGDILQVQKALGHASVRTTQGYLHNNVIRQQCDRNWRAFLGHFWDGIETGIVDPTLLAKLCKDGMATAGEIQTLVDYRELQRSRIAVPCRDPYNPPKGIDPTFVPDGKNTCIAQRCTLCLSNAVLAPDSWPGLCMRLAELRHLQSILPVEIFTTTGSFGVELHNTEQALLAFSNDPVEEHVALWAQRIARGEHFPPETV
jgi:hypothetical protein